MENREWKKVYWSIAAAAVSGSAAYYSANYMDCFSGGCAIAFISLFLLVSALGTAAFFMHRARAADEIISGKNLLAHWTYTDEETRKSVEREYASYREADRALFIVAGVCSSSP